METKVNQRRIERIRKSCGFNNGINVSADGSRGGLSLGWKDNVNISLMIFSQYHINININEENQDESWRFTGFYGSPIEQSRKDSWNLLCRLKAESNDPWLVLGDFNEIMFSFEKDKGELGKKDK